MKTTINFYIFETLKSFIVSKKNKRFWTFIIALAGFIFFVYQFVSDKEEKVERDKDLLNHINEYLVQKEAVEDKIADLDIKLASKILELEGMKSRPLNVKIQFINEIENTRKKRDEGINLLISIGIKLNDLEKMAEASPVTKDDVIVYSYDDEEKTSFWARCRGFFKKSIKFLTSPFREKNIDKFIDNSILLSMNTSGDSSFVENNPSFDSLITVYVTEENSDDYVLNLTQTNIDVPDESDEDTESQSVKENISVETNLDSKLNTTIKKNISLDQNGETNKVVVKPTKGPKPNVQITERMKNLNEVIKHPWYDSTITKNKSVFFVFSDGICTTNFPFKGNKSKEAIEYKYEFRYDTLEHYEYIGLITTNDLNAKKNIKAKIKFFMSKPTKSGNTCKISVFSINDHPKKDSPEYIFTDYE